MSSAADQLKFVVPCPERSADQVLRRPAFATKATRSTQPLSQRLLTVHAAQRRAMSCSASSARASNAGGRSADR